MEKIEISQNNTLASQGNQPTNEDEFQQLVQSLPKERKLDGSFLYFYQGFWCPSMVLKAFISFQTHFQALDDDIILISFPKSGTTWLKSLIFTIVNRNRFEFKSSLLLNSNPHELVPFLEYDIYLRENPSLYLENNISNPRIFSTHTPYASLPPSIKHSKCKIVYVCRNPMDVFISYWHFSDKIRSEEANQISLNEAFEKFHQGIHSYGPFFDHVLGYWNAAHKESYVYSNKILFLKYEDLKENTILQIKELADFLGFSFSKEEEDLGVVEEVVKLCSFESLKNIEVNKTSGKSALSWVPNTAYFRKGVVGDWNNYLTPSMVERLENLINEKLGDTGLTFKK